MGSGVFNHKEVVMCSTLEIRHCSLLGAALVAAMLVGCDKPAEVTPPPAPPAPPAPVAKSAPPPAPRPAPPPQQPAQPAPPSTVVVVPPPAPPAPPPPVAVAPKPIPAGRWELLGERQADLKLDRDRIQVGRRDGRFRQLQLTVRGAPLEVYDMVVTFGNGQQYKPNLRFHFDERTTSRVIDLPGDTRVIKQVDFVYRTSARRQGKATISLYGR
jgi:hypothetical protein